MELYLYQAFLADVTVGHAVVFMPVFWHHNDQLFVGQLGPRHLFMVLKVRQKPFHCVCPAVCEWPVPLAASFHNYLVVVTYDTILPLWAAQSLQTFSAAPCIWVCVFRGVPFLSICASSVHRSVFSRCACFGCARQFDLFK